MENNPAPHHTRITLEYYIHMSSEKPVTTRAIYISKLLGSQPSLFDLLNPCRRSKYALCTGWSSTLIEGVFEVPSQSVIPNPIAATAPRASTACKILFESTELVREGSGVSSDLTSTVGVRTASNSTILCTAREAISKAHYRGVHSTCDHLF